MAAHPQHHHWTLEQYVAHEQHTGVRHEYIDGQIYSMIGGLFVTLISAETSFLLLKHCYEIKGVYRLIQMRA
jgi:hypothetical protein